MGKYTKIKILIFLLFLLSLQAEISGYFQVSSYMSDFNKDLRILQIERLRLKFNTEILGLSAKVQVEQGAFSSPLFYQPYLTGSFLGEGNPVYLYKGEEERFYFYMDRASLSYESEKFSFTAGRDRFPWGKARLFSVLDIFNPYEPFALSKEERQGVNGARARLYFSGFSWAEAVYVKRKAGNIYGGGIFFSVYSFDFQICSGKYFGKKFYGGAFEGDIKGVGIRGEVVKFERQRSEYTLGFDFQASPKLYIVGEILRSNGTLFPDIKLYAISSSYEISPLLKFTLTGVYTIPESKILMLSFEYSIEENMDIGFSFLYSTKDSYWMIPRIFGTATKIYF